MDNAHIFGQLLNKMGEYGNHHQLIFTALVAFLVICVSWGVESFLENYFFPKKPFYGYVLAVAGGLAALWVIQHFILHVL